MRFLVVDTAGWVACADAADETHQHAYLARDVALEAGEILVTTGFAAGDRRLL
jgi:hypothetical protein